jgi:hypothetical protein
MVAKLSTRLLSSNPRQSPRCPGLPRLGQSFRGRLIIIVVTEGCVRHGIEPPARSARTRRTVTLIFNRLGRLLFGRVVEGRGLRLWDAGLIFQAVI